MDTFSEKQSRNPHSKRSSKPFESKRWDHGGFDQLQLEQATREKHDEKEERYKKPKKYQESNTLASDTMQRRDKGNNKKGSNFGKWSHDKYEEVENANDQRGQQQGWREAGKPYNQKEREKRPDRQLYSVRFKRENQDEPRNEQAKKQQIEGNNHQERMKNSEIAKEINENEIIINEDETKSSTSNVSTSISDPLKGFEEESNILKEGKSAQMAKGLVPERITETKKEQEEPLLELVLDAGKREFIKMYRDEENYEIILDNYCTNNGIGRRMGLYLKINVLKFIQENHPEFKKIDSILDKLLDLNYKLIMAERNDGTFPDPEILPYIKDEEYSS